MKALTTIKEINFTTPPFLLCMVVLLLVVGTGIVAPLLVPYGKSIGLNGFMLGTLFFGFYAIRVLLATPIGKLSDRMGVRNILLISLLIYLFVACLYFIANSYPSLLSARLVHGISSAMMLPMAMAYLGLLSPSGQEGRYMGYYNSAVFLANAIGPLLGGVISENYGFQGAFISLFILAVLALTVSFFGLPPVNNVTKPAAQDPEQNVSNEASKTSFSNNNLILVAMLAVGFSAAAFSMHSISFFVLYLDEIGTNTAHIGLLLSLYNLTIALTQVPFGKIADSSYNKILLTIANILVVATCCILPTLQQFSAITIVIIIAGLASSLALIISTTYLTKIGKEIGMGTVMGKLSTVQSLGFAFTPLISGVLVDKFSSEYTFYLVALFWAFSAFLSILIVNKNKD